MRLRSGLSGWLTTAGAVGLAFLWFALFRLGVVPKYLAIALLIATAAITTWMPPYLMAARLRRKDEHTSSGNGKVRL